MTIRETLTRFISEELLEQDEPVGAEDNLLSDGMVDSLGMLRLVAFIEAEFSMKIPPEDFTIEHFRSIEVLGNYLDDRLNG